MSELGGLGCWNLILFLNCAYIVHFFSGTIYIVGVEIFFIGYYENFDCVEKFMSS